MLRTPCKPGLSPRDQFRAGRAELMRTPFSIFERNIRDQLARMLGRAGFDAARDVEGITVNRLAHGYAFSPSSLFDPDSPEDQKPWVVGRKPFGRITIRTPMRARALIQTWRLIKLIAQSQNCSVAVKRAIGTYFCGGGAFWPLLATTNSRTAGATMSNNCAFGFSASCNKANCSAVHQSGARSPRLT